MDILFNVIAKIRFFHKKTDNPPTTQKTTCCNVTPCYKTYAISLRLHYGKMLYPLLDQYNYFPDENNIRDW